MFNSLNADLRGDLWSEIAIDSKFLFENQKNFQRLLKKTMYNNVSSKILYIEFISEYFVKKLI